MVEYNDSFWYSYHKYYHKFAARISYHSHKSPPITKPMYLLINFIHDVFISFSCVQKEIIAFIPLLIAVYCQSKEKKKRVKSSLRSLIYWWKKWLMRFNIANVFLSRHRIRGEEIEILCIKKRWLKSSYVCITVYNRQCLRIKWQHNIRRGHHILKFIRISNWTSFI